jgi:hypothetical protein
MARVQSTTTEAFDELRIALNPLLGDLYPVFRFEQFRDCPIDIRFLIYEAYFRAESSRPQPKSVSMNRTVRNSSSPPVWLRIDVTRPTPWILEDKMKVPLPFFPNLCLIDKRFGKEAATCLFRTANISVRGPSAQRWFVNTAERFLAK